MDKGKLCRGSACYVLCGECYEGNECVDLVALCCHLLLYSVNILSVVIKLLFCVPKLLM